MTKTERQLSQATFEFQVDYDPRKTTLADLERVLDHLMSAANATPDILDEYGNPEIGEIRLSAPDPNARIAEVLRSDDLDTSSTIEKLMECGGRLIAKAIPDLPKAVFRLDGDEGWWQASIELNVYPADPSDVKDLRDELADEKEAEAE